MNYNDQENNNNFDIFQDDQMPCEVFEQDYAVIAEDIDAYGVDEYQVVEHFESVEYQPEAIEYSESEYLPDDDEHFIDMEYSVLENAPDEDDYCWHEIMPEELDYLEEGEFIGLQSIPAEAEDSQQEFVLFAADGTLLSYRVGDEVFEAEPEALAADEPMYDNDGLLAEPHSAFLNVSVGGWSNIPASNWTSGTINVTSNITWSLSRNVTWLTPSISLGSWSGNRSFTVNVAQNTSVAARTGTVTVSGSGITRTMSFHQLGAAPAANLTVSTGGWSNIPASNWTSGTINVTSNITWSLSRNVTWLTPSISLGNWSGNRSFTVNVAQNTSTAARTGTVTVSGSGITRTMSFHQLGAAPAANLTVSTTGWNTISAAGWTSGTINVTSNITWALSRNVTWLTPSISLGNWSGNRSFTVNVAQNTSTAARTGMVAASGSGITRNISFQQVGAAPAANLTVSVGGWSNVPASSWTSGTINVTSNITWTLSRSVTWLTPSLNLGNWSGNRSFTVQVAQNTFTAVRTGNVIVSGGGIIRNISFQQLGAVTRTVTFNANGGTVSPTSRSVVNGNQVGALPIPSRANHTFIGWFSTSATTGGVERTSTFVVASDITFWARWRTNSPTIRNPLANATIERQNLVVRWDIVPGATYTIAMRNLRTDQITLPTVNLPANTGQFTIQASALGAGDRHRIAVSAVTANAVNGWSEREFYVRGNQPRVELLTTAQVNANWGGAWQVIPLQDVNTGRTSNISWNFHSRHTDWSPTSANDTAIIKSILRPGVAVDDPSWANTSSWSWNARPGIITIGGRRVAVGFHLFPHGSILGGAQPGWPLRQMPDTPPAGGWPIGGHMCMYYGDSTGGGGADWTRQMNDAARDAYNRSR